MTQPATPRIPPGNRGRRETAQLTSGSACNGTTTLEFGMSASANRPDGALTSRCGRPAGTTRRTGRADTTPTLAAGFRHKFPHHTPHREPCVSTPKQLSPCTKPRAARRRPAATAQRKHNGTSTGGAGGQHQPTAGEAEGSVFSPRPLRQRTGDERGTHQG